MTGDALSNLVEPLLSFGERLGIPSECWAEREELGQIRYTNSEFSRESAVSLTLELITPLLQAYGDALSCHFRLGDLTVLNITQTISEADLYNFQNQTQDSPTLGLSFRLNKKQLIQNLLEESATHKFHLYLFPQALERLLSSVLEQLESQLWNSEPARKVIMLVPSRQIWLDGPYLAILGGEKVKDYQEALPQKLHNSEELQSIYHKCRDILKWQEVKLQYLTPLHFKVAGQTRPNDLIVRAVQVHLAKLIVLYTADRTVIRTNGHWLATYVGARQSVDLVPGDLANLLDEEICSGVNILLKMFEWTYDLQRIDDRLGTGLLRGDC